MCLSGLTVTPLDAPSQKDTVSEEFGVFAQWVLNYDVNRGFAFQGHPGMVLRLTFAIPAFSHELLSTRLGAWDTLLPFALLSLFGVTLSLLDHPGFHLLETSETSLATHALELIHHLKCCVRSSLSHQLPLTTGPRSPSVS